MLCIKNLLKIKSLFDALKHMLQCLMNFLGYFFLIIFTPNHHIKNVFLIFLMTFNISTIFYQNKIK
jgi:hypothetical protein